MPGDFFDLTFSEVARYSAEAITVVAACRFDRTRLFNVISRDRMLLQQVFRMASEEIAVAHEQLTTLGRLVSDEKIAWFLLTLRARLAKTAQLSDEVPLPMTRQDIADHLGLTTETVSRAIARMGREGVLHVATDRVHIRDLPRLQSLVGPISAFAAYRAE